MKNRERYEKEIMDIACNGDRVAVVDGKPVPCERTSCENCDLHKIAMKRKKKNCNEWRKEWCEAEYVEPQVDWSKVAVDTPILVRNVSDKKWYKRYFAEFKGEHVYAWSEGATSWSNAGDRDSVFWSYAKLAETDTEKPC